MAKADTPSAFLDADVLVAGSYSASGASNLILRLGELTLIDTVSCDQARREAERNLAAKLPAGLPVFRAITTAAIRWVPDPREEELTTFRAFAHAKDVPILAAAARSGCGSLVTFNMRDYWPPRDVIRIEQPAEFVRRLRRALEALGNT